LFVEYDASNGIHNPAYAVGILKASIASLATGDIGAGSITAVEDVPNDQGKQVRVTWARFPGDGTGDPRITRYGVWRKVETTSGKISSGKVTNVADYDEMFSYISNAEGVLFKVANSAETWDFVKELPAAGLAVYSTVVPTIYDSTITDGQYLSYFKISGHASNNTVVMSESASGYSLDNLAPTKPSGLKAQIVNFNVVLDWDEPVDEDFKYFAIYRGTTSGFTPDASLLAGTAATNSFSDFDLHVDGTFYYKVVAVDFSGNEGEASDELMFAVTDVKTGASFPALLTTIVK